MAAKKIVRKVTRKPVAIATKRTVKSTTKANTKANTKPTIKSAPTGAARTVLLAGIGAAERATVRLQDNAMKVYGAIARETNRLSEMTAEAAQTMARKAGVLVAEGQKIQSSAQSAAEAKAREVAKDVKAFAAKSDKTLKKNVKGAVNAMASNAKEGVTRLEQVFEARVAKTLNTFGVPSSQNVRELQARMTELQKALAQLNKRGVQTSRSARA
jgi:hypothetical protein